MVLEPHPRRLPPPSEAAIVDCLASAVIPKEFDPGMIRKCADVGADAM